MNQLTNEIIFLKCTYFYLILLIGSKNFMLQIFFYAINNIFY